MSAPSAEADGHWATAQTRIHVQFARNQGLDVGPIPLAFNEEAGTVRFPRFRSSRRPQPNPEAWHTRQRDSLGRLIRGTEAPTDSSRCW